MIRKCSEAAGVPTFLESNASLLVGKLYEHDQSVKVVRPPNPEYPVLLGSISRKDLRLFFVRMSGQFLPNFLPIYLGEFLENKSAHVEQKFHVSQVT